MVYGAMQSATAPLPGSGFTRCTRRYKNTYSAAICLFGYVMAAAFPACTLCGQTLNTDDPFNISRHQGSAACKRAVAAREAGAKQPKISSMFRVTAPPATPTAAAAVVAVLPLPVVSPPPTLNAATSPTAAATPAATPATQATDEVELISCRGYARPSLFWSRVLASE